MTASADPRPALLQQAATLAQQGRLHDAIAAYTAILARWPDLPNSWYNLARLQANVRRPGDALASYQQALDRGVAQPEEAHLNRAVLLTDQLRRDDAALAELRRALALNPRYVPAWLNLGNLNEDLGLRDEAALSYERALDVDPECHEALARYAALVSTPARQDSLIARMAAFIAKPATGARDRALLGFALGKLLDARSDYSAAFDAYAAANRASRALAAPGTVLYDRRAHEAFIDALIAAFPRASTVAPPPTAAEPHPLFICGMFRSGSTLIEQVLASHSGVTAGGELEFLPTLVRTALSPFPARVAQLSPRELAAWADAYRADLAQRFPGAATVTDKRPDNYLLIGLIKQLFPAARIVHTTRHPLDNILSIYFLHLDHGMGYALDLEDTAHYYRQYRRLMAHWQSLYGSDILDVDYDTFVREPRAVTGALLEFCGLPWQGACLAFHRTRNAVKTASVWQVREPLYQRSSGRWQHYAREIAPLRASLADLL